MGKNNRKLTNSDILAKCRETHGNRYSYPDGCDTRGGNADTKIRIKCHEHGEFLQGARSHYFAGRGCPECALKRRGAKRAITGSDLHQRFLAGGKEVHGGKYEYPEANFVGKTAKNKITIMCRDHGPFEQTYHSHIKNKQGCRQCAIERIFAPETKMARLEAIGGSPAERQTQFLKNAHKHHGNTYKYPFLKKELIQAASLVTVVCPECGPVKQPAYIHERGHGCRNCYRSTVERALGRYIQSLLPKGEEVLHSDRKTVRPYELDIYVPSRKVAVEYGAVFWHSEDAKGLRYHSTKQLRCQKLGITLLTIFDADWNDAKKQRVIKGRIKSALGLVNRSIYGRKCTITPITKEQAKPFLDSNHLQGYRPAKLHLGIFETETNDLVSVASFGKPRFSRAYEWELIRFASRIGVSVVGGLSKAVAYFEREIKPRNMVSYADLRWGTGRSYEKAGFRFSHRTTPARWYAHKSNTDSRMLHRMAVQKHRLPALLGEGFDPTKSASANLMENGYLAIGDCGNNVYTWQPTGDGAEHRVTIH